MKKAEHHKSRASVPITGFRRVYADELEQQVITEVLAMPDDAEKVLFFLDGFDNIIVGIRADITAAVFQKCEYDRSVVGLEDPDALPTTYDVLWYQNGKEEHSFHYSERDDKDIERGKRIYEEYKSMYESHGFIPVELKHGPKGEKRNDK